MQATLDAASLKHITKALTCLSKYGDELILQATPERLLLHTTNSSATAYCRFIYRNQFFTRFRVGSASVGINVGEYAGVDGQLSTKSLLSILKHRTVEKTVNKCELSIVDGDPAPTGSTTDEDHDSLESKLIIRLHCKHGVVKTHKLLLSETSRHMAPNVPDSFEQSRLSIGPRAIKDIIEHFPISKSAKSDPQLIWSFSDDEVQVRSQESSLDSRGSAQLATELTVGAEEFDTYTIHTSPVTIAFHLREFNAAIAFAESCNLTLDLRFTDPADPLFIEAEGGDLYDTLFIISMSQVTGAPTSNSQSHPRAPAAQARPLQRLNKKRPLERDDDSPPEADHLQASGSSISSRSNGAAKNKSHKAAVPSDPATVAREGSGIRDTPARSMPPPTLPASVIRHMTPLYSQTQVPPPQPSIRPQVEEPLFLPSSQLSQVDQDMIRESGLGIENMNMDEFNAMMEDDGEDVFNHDYDSPGVKVEMDGDEGQNNEDDSLGIHDDTEMAPTQEDQNRRTFRPLFDD